MPVYFQIISLGRKCDVAQNVRRIYGRKFSHYFDWLITPFDTMVSLIEKDFAGAFEREDLVLRRSRISVANTANQISYLHAFERDAEKLIPKDALELQYDEVRAKFDFLRERWLETLARGRPLLFVVHHEVSQAELEGLQDLLRTKVAGHFDLLCVRRPTVPGEFTEREGLFHRIVRKGPDYTGDPGSWDRAFAGFQVEDRGHE